MSQMHESIVSFLNSAVANCNATANIAEVGDSSITVDAGFIRSVCLALRDSDDFKFKVLQTITGCDYSEYIEISYILASFHNNLELILKAQLSREQEVPTIDSVCGVWKAANFQERECYDMLGVNFLNHPDLRRILCPDDWQGYPLRKDYVPAEIFNGMVINPMEKNNTVDQGFLEKFKAGVENPKLVSGSWKVPVGYPQATEKG